MNVIVNRTDDEKSIVEERESCTTLDALIEDEGSKVASNGSWRVASSFTVLPLQNCSMGPGSRSRTYTLPFGACKKKSPDGRSAPNNSQSACEAALCSDEAGCHKGVCPEGGREGRTSRAPPARPVPPQPMAYSSAARPPDVPPYPETNHFEQSQHALCATFGDAPQTWNDYTRSASYEPKTYPNKLYPQSEDQCDDCVQSSFVVSNGDIWEMVSVHGEVDDEDTLSPMSSKPLSGKASPPCTDSPRRVASSRHAFKQLFSYQQKTADICDRESRTQINYPSSTQNMVKVCKRVCSSLRQDNISRQFQCTNFEGPSKQNYKPPPNSTPQLNLEHEYTNELQHKCIEPPRRPLQMDFDIEYHKQPPQKCEQPPRRTNMDNFQPPRVHCKLPQKIYELPLERAQRSNDLSSNKQSLQNYQPSACSQARKGCKSCSILTRIHPPSKRDSQEYLPPSTTFRSRFDDPTYDIKDYKSKTEQSRKSSPSKCPPVSGCGPLPIDHQSWMHYPQNESCIDPNGHTLNQEHPMICWPKPQCSQMFTNRPAFCKYSNSARITPTKYSPSSLLFQNLPSTPQCNKVSNCSNSDRFKPSTPYQVLNSPAAEIPKSIKNCALRDNDIPKCAVPDPNLTACDQPDNSCPPEVCRTCTQLPRSLPERRTGSVPPLPSTVYDSRKNFTDLPNQNCSKPNVNQKINSFATEGHSSASASSSESISRSSNSASCDQTKPCANPSLKQHKKETCQKSGLALLEDGHKSSVTNPPDGLAPSEQKPPMKSHQLRRNATRASVECTENVLDSVEDNGKPVKPVRENRWQESRKKPVPQEDQCETHEKRKPWWKKFAKNSGKWKCSESVKAKYTK